MILLYDIGNTHTHLGLADLRGIRRQTDIPTPSWLESTAGGLVQRWLGSAVIDGAAICSVVPRATSFAAGFTREAWGITPLELTPRTLRGVGIDYPKPASIGPDRLANAVAACHRFGAPVVVVDFGTAVTFDVVDRVGNYSGGIIAPGLAAMTEYLHEKTALLPRITIREVRGSVGKSTKEAMLIGAVHGYRGLVRELIMELKKELKCPRLRVAATGGYAKLISARLPEITTVDPLLTLEGLRLVWLAHYGPEKASRS